MQGSIITFEGITDLRKILATRISDRLECGEFDVKHYNFSDIIPKNNKPTYNNAIRKDLEDGKLIIFEEYESLRSLNSKLPEPDYTVFVSKYHKKIDNIPESLLLEDMEESVWYDITSTLHNYLQSNYLLFDTKRLIENMGSNNIK